MLKKWIRFALIVCLAAVFQAGLIDLIAVTDLRIKPDLLLVLLVFFAIFSNTFDAIITSFLIGFTADLIAPGLPIGPKMISFGLIGTAVAYANSVFAVRKLSYQAVAIFIAGLLTGTLTHLFNLLAGQPTERAIFTIVAATSLYSALIGPVLFLPSVKWLRIKANRFSRH